jgi:hypothetical protein
VRVQLKSVLGASHRRSRVGIGVVTTLVAIALGPCLIRARPAQADVEAATHLTLFTEPSNVNKGVRVIHPQTEVSATTGNVGIAAGYELDVVSGATARVYAPGDAPDAVSGATFSDTRQAARGTLSFETATVAFSGGYSYGTENDYKSHTLTAQARGDFFERNFSLSLGYTHNFDRVCDAANAFAQGPLYRVALGNSEGCFTVGTDKAIRKLAIDTFEPALSWTATPLTLIAAGLSLQVLDGFQSNPYRTVRVGSSGQTPQESLPQYRQRYAVFGRLHQALPLVRSAVRLGGRLYRDTWDVRAASVDGEWLSYFAPALILGVRGRWHKQGSAVFFRTAEDLRSLGPTGQYWTGDRELAALSNLMLGGVITFVKAPPTDSPSFYKEIELDVRFDILYYRPQAGAPSSDRPYAHIIQAGARIRF